MPRALVLCALVALTIPGFATASLPIVQGAVVSAAPANAVDNPGFESGLTGWNWVRPGDLVEPGASGAGHAFRIGERPGAGFGYAWQPIGPVERLADRWTLSFAFKTDASDAGGVHGQIVNLMEGLEGPSPRHVISFHVTGSEMWLASSAGYSLPVVAPADGVWHAARIEMASDGFARLVVDGTTAVTHSGLPSPTGSLTLRVGQIAGELAPFAEYDDFALSPMIRRV